MQKYKYKIGSLALENISAIPVWTIISFVAIITGFVGFYTYSAIYSIPYNQADIFRIGAFGVYNFMFWIIIYSAIKSPYKVPVFRSIYIASILFLIGGDPTKVAAAMILIITLQTDYLWDRIKSKNYDAIIEERELSNNNGDEVTNNEDDSKELIERATRYLNAMELKQYLVGLYRREFIGKKRIDAIALLLALIISLFWESTITLIVLYILYIQYELGKIFVTKQIKPVHIFFLIFFTPAFLSYYVLDKTGFSLAGIAKTKIDIYKDDDVMEGAILLFQDYDNIYILKNEESDSTLVLNKEDISKIILIDKINGFKWDDGIINKFRENK